MQTRRFLSTMWLGQRRNAARSSRPTCTPSPQNYNALQRLLSVVLALGGFLLAGPLHAQLGGSGSISGAITDTTGASVGGATVTATNTATNVTTTQTTSGGGTYTLSPLIPGVYTVTINAKGFKVFAQQNVRVDALATITVNSQLSVGSSNETVTITAAPPQLDTTNATTGFVMESEDYTELPLQINGSARNPTSFVYLTPGVSHGGVAVQTGIFNGTGSQGRVDEVYINGFPQTSIYEQGDPRYVSSAISVEAVDQFQVVTGNQSAQYQGLGLENYVIKSGTNQIHGSVFEYMRTTALDTWGFFAPSVINPTTGTAVKPNEHQSEYGLNLGGPIKKDKIFYFGNYDGYYYHKDNNPTYTTYPTTLMAQGNFNQLLPAGTSYSQCVYSATNPNPPAGCLYDPSTCPTGTQASGTCVRTPFDYNGIVNNINPSLEGSTEKFMTSFLPTPINTNLVNNYLSQIPSFTSSWKNTNHVDWKVDNRQLVSFVFAVSRGAPYGYQSNGSNPGPLPYTSGQGYETKNKIFLLEHTFTATPNLINQLKYGYTRLWAPVYNPDFRNKGFGIGTNGGVTGLPAGQASASFPTVTFSGGSSVAGTVANTEWSGDQDYNSMTNYFSLVDNVQYVKGNHSLTFGFTKEFLELNEFQYSTGTQPLQLTYSNAQTALYVPTINSTTLLPTGSVQTTTTGNSFASLYLGDVNSASFTQLPYVDTGAREHNLSIYAQDDWRPIPKLSVNLGLRWDFYPPYQEAQNRSTWFSPAVTNPLTGNAGALVFAGHGGAPYCNCSTPVVSWYKNFGPRIGVAYSLRPTTVFRAGFAVTYSHGTGVRNATYLGTGTSGYSAAPSFVATTGGDSAFNLNGGIPAYTTPPIISGSYGTFYTSQPHGSAVSMAFPDPYVGGRAPYANNYTVGIEQQLTKDLALEVNYVGSQGHFLPVNSGGARGYFNNALNPTHWNLGSLLGQTYSATTLAAAQAIDPTVALPYSTFSGGTIQQMLLPFPQYSGVGDTYDNIDNSTYNAAQVILRKRMSNGLQFYFNYSFSEEEDDNGTYRDGYLPLRVERSRGLIDEPSIVNGTAVYQLPFGQGHALGNRNAIERAFAGGWQVSGIYTFNSGIPLAIVATGCTSPGTGQCMPNYNPAYGGPVRINGSYGRGQTATHLVNYLAPQAFINAPPIYTFGNVQRTAPDRLRGPTSYDLDMSVKKNIVIHENWNAVFDISAYNVTNVTIFSGPAVSTGSASTFGQMSSQSNSSRDIQLAFRVNW
jgi:Carboxypeptidase regulatory-like domain